MGKPNERGQDARLEGLAEKINDSHQRCLKSLRASLDHARRTGTLLIEAQALVEDAGEPWLPWVQEHCQFSVSQAQRYMRVADRYEELLRQVDDPKNLTLTEALKLLSPGRKPEESGTREAKDLRLTVASQQEFDELVQEAEQFRFDDDSRERQFVKEKPAALARQVLGLAKRAKSGDGDALRAVALVRQLRRALKPSLVVLVSKPKPSKAEPHARHKPALNGHAGKNRLNGKATVAASR